jgi:hypothetical protein
LRGKGVAGLIASAQSPNPVTAFRTCIKHQQKTPHLKKIAQPGLLGPERIEPDMPYYLNLELIQTHMAQKPLLWVEVGAYAVRKL